MAKHDGRLEDVKICIDKYQKLEEEKPSKAQSATILPKCWSLFTTDFSIDRPEEEDEDEMPQEGVYGPVGMLIETLKKCNYVPAMILASTKKENPS